ncbi:hypothetical protein LTR17_027131 [Elasticomyces elasticus]|nr:hypothetical protein LTR17_027131 [Elasticomyces elasticus]
MLVSLTTPASPSFLTHDKCLIELPSILLPPNIHSGSIVDINVLRNTPAEERADQAFSQLQNTISATFGSTSPSAPVLRCRNATQTSVVLEWDEIQLVTAELRSLSLYRNGAKAGNIPVGKQSTKISGLALDTEYTFHLVSGTSLGQYVSEKLMSKTHKMTDLHGITVTPGVMPGQLKDSLAETVSRIGAKMIECVRIDTTHFVCTEPRGLGWEKVIEMNFPVVVPDWVLGCEREGKIIGVRAYYLDADPSKGSIGPSQQQQQQDASRQSGQGQGGNQGQQQQQQQRQAQSQQQSGAPPPAPPKLTDDAVARESNARSTTAASSIAGTTLAETSTPETATAHAKGEGLEKQEPDVSDEEEDENGKAVGLQDGKARSEACNEEEEDGEGPNYISEQEAADAAEEDDGEGKGDEGDGEKPRH